MTHPMNFLMFIVSSIAFVSTNDSRNRHLNANGNICGKDIRNPFAKKEPKEEQPPVSVTTSIR